MRSEFRSYWCPAVWVPVPFLFLSENLSIPTSFSKSHKYCKFATEICCVANFIYSYWLVAKTNVALASSEQVDTALNLDKFQYFLSLS